MKNFNFVYALPFIFIFSLIVFYSARGMEQEMDTVFLSLSIFLFATLSGFFISSQAKRYSKIVSKVTDFDGTMSFLYRSISVFGTDAQEKMSAILQKHYGDIMKHTDWDFYFNHKTTTLTDVNRLVDNLTTKGTLNGGQSAFASRAYFGLGDMQKIRKNLIALYKARIPAFQWYLLDSIAVILIGSILVIPTHTAWFPLVVKAASTTVVIAVLILLRKINNLDLFEDMAGQSSAQDVLDIIKGTR